MKLTLLRVTLQGTHCDYMPRKQKDINEQTAFLFSINLIHLTHEPRIYF
jgi:hypothetical protein